MHFDEPPLSTILDPLRGAGVRNPLILVVALIAVQPSTVVVPHILKTLFHREATEGTARELSAVEIEKRMTTLDGLGGNVIRFLVVAIAGIMLLGALGLDIGPAVAGLGV